ncbi:MAG: alpha-2-macroglobulin family protein, partial [Chloroflexota bacterium]
MTAQKVEINDNGVAYFEIPVTSEGEQDISAVVIDSSNYSAEASKKVYSGKNKVVVKVIPEQEKLIPGINNEIYVFTSRIDGTPVKTYITITGDKTKQVSTDSNGVAKFTVMPTGAPAGNYYSAVSDYLFNLNITDDNGNVLAQQENSLPVGGFGLAVRPDKNIYSVNEKLNLNIISNIDNGVAHLVISKNGQPLKMINTEQDNVEIELPKDTYGLIDIYAEKQGNFKDYNFYYSNNKKCQCFKSVFIRPNKIVNFTINKENRFYKPGEDLQLSFNISDGNNNALNSAIMISVVDEALAILRQNDMSLDNIRLALADMDLNETVNDVDLYTAILNSAPNETLSALLLKRNTPPLEFKESNFDNIQKKEMTWVNLLKWFAAALVLLFIILFVKFKWFRFSLLHFIGILAAIFFAMWLVRPSHHENTRALITIVAAIGGYILIVRSFSAKKEEDKNMLRNPVSAGVSLVILLLVAGYILEYSEPIIVKNTGITEDATMQMDNMATDAPQGFSAGDISGIKNDMQRIESSASEDAIRRSNAVGNAVDAITGAFQPHNKSTGTSDDYSNNTSPANQKTNYAEVKKLRMQFLESMYFNPQVIAESGKATVTIPLADNITTWRIQAVANSLNGYIGSGKESIKVFQDFFVDFELPKNLTVGDEVSIPVTVFNYLNQDQKVKLTVHSDNWFAMQGENNKVIEVNANDQKFVYIPIKVNKFGNYSFRVDALGQAMSDAVQKEVKVYPNGFKMQEVCASGIIEKKADEKVFFFDNDIQGTRKIRIKVYPTPAAQVVEGIEAILQMPTGCFEQTSSSLYPDILALKYLKDTKKSNPGIEAKANRYIELGFQRLLTFEVKGQKGGFSLFGEAPAEILLTAYGLMELNDLKEVYPVDENIAKRMKEFIFSKQQYD